MKRFLGIMPHYALYEGSAAKNRRISRAAVALEPRLLLGQ